jgi:hypothetical protein
MVRTFVDRGEGEENKNKNYVKKKKAKYIFLTFHLCDITSVVHHDEWNVVVKGRDKF